MTCKTLIIHLLRADARAEHVRRLEALLPAEIMPATDGETLGADDLLAFDRAGGGFPPYPFDLRKGEIAAFLSHRACWKVIAEGVDDAMLVLEDDVEIAPETFREAMALGLSAAGPDDIVRFPAWRPERFGRTVARAGAIDLRRPFFVGRGAHAQLIGRNAAARLLERSSRFDRPVDEFLGSPWLSGVRPLSIWPNGVTEISGALSGSLIGRDKSGVERLRREILRPVYRAARIVRAAAAFVA